MQRRMLETDGFGGNADIHQSTCVCHVAEGLRHRLMVARGVGNYGVHVAASDLAQLLQLTAIATEQDGMRYPIGFAAEL